MKKILATFIVVVCCCVSLFADFDYRLDLFSFDPLYEPYLGDKDNPALAFNYIWQFKQFPDHVYQEGDGNYPNIPGDGHICYFPLVEENRTGGVKADMQGKPFLGQVKLGETLSLFRNTFTFDSVLSPISFDFTFMGNMNILMEGKMADMVGYDGVYHFGLNFRFADKVAFKVMAKHYCTHYGDSILKRIPVDMRDDFWVTYKYVVMNAVDIGLSITPTDWLRLYGEYAFIPSLISSYRPIIFRPTHIESLNTFIDFPSSYKGQIVGFGIELSYPIFPKLGKTTFAYDCHMYEHGKIIYMDRTKTGEDRYLPFPEDPSNPKENEIHYDPDAPWAMEHGLTLNQQINDYLSFEIGVHFNGAPLHLFYFLDEAAYTYVGLRFDPNPTCTIYDTSKR